MRDLAIRNTHPTVVTILGEVEAWDKDGNTVTLDETLIQAEIIRLQELYDSQEYARLRKAEYDQLNQDELRFDDLENGTTVWVDTINEIKARYPKP
jgi:hypothetical protein